MKKLLLVLAVAGVFAACNDEKKAGEETKTPDTTATTPAPATPDTSAKTAADTSAKPAVDTTKK